jgi:hypothetical protein
VDVQEMIDTQPSLRLVVDPVEKNLPENYRKSTEYLPDVTSELASEAIEQEETFSGLKEGRQRTKDQVDEVLDYIVEYGIPPKGLSMRMRNYYIHHPRLSERKKAHAREKKTRKRKKDNTSKDA